MFAAITIGLGPSAVRASMVISLASGLSALMVPAIPRVRQASRSRSRLSAILAFAHHIELARGHSLSIFGNLAAREDAVADREIGGHDFDELVFGFSPGGMRMNTVLSLSVTVTFAAGGGGYYHLAPIRRDLCDHAQNTQLGDRLIATGLGEQRSGYARDCAKQKQETS